MSTGETFEVLEYGPAPESPEMALDWIASHGGEFQHFIGGEWVDGESKFATHNPATTEVLAHVAQGSPAAVDQAVAAAQKALAGWQAMSCHERSRILYAIARQIQKHSRLFAVLESLDNGKPIRESRDIDIPLVARHFYYHAGWAALRDREFPDAEAVGVCGQIIPWNFPLLMLAWKIAPALAMGNTVVLKPAEYTPLTALFFAEVCQAAGVPDGVVNIVTGDGATGRAIVEHPDIQKIAFTGSTEVGQIIRRSTAGSGKKLSLELGGKSPFIVFEDADLDAAVEGVVDAIWFNQGQVCCAGSRLLVQEGVAKKFYAKLRDRMESLRIGDPLDKAVDVGAIVDGVQLSRIQSLVEAGSDPTVEVYHGSCPLPEKGWFYPPTLITGVSPASVLAQDEIFGPVLVAMTFRTPSEAVALANNTVYGLASSIWTENVNVAHDMASKIHAGIVWLNCTNQFDAAAPFGGYKESGFGREGGREGLSEYLKTPIEAWPEFEEQPMEPPRIDRTHKLYIGGKQVRPDGGNSLVVAGVEVGLGNRKDIRNAVEAARAAQPGWAHSSGHAKAQILYFLAENLSEGRDAFIRCGVSESEIEHSIESIFTLAAYTDKYDGRSAATPLRAVVYTIPEALGVVGFIAPAKPSLFGLIEGVLPLVALGNAVVALPSESNPVASMELVRILETSDIPGGIINLITGHHTELAPVLAGHDGVHAIWNFGDASLTEVVEKESAHNVKQTYCVTNGLPTLSERLRRSTQTKVVWTPFGA